MRKTILIIAAMTLLTMEGFAENVNRTITKEIIKPSTTPLIKAIVPLNIDLNWKYEEKTINLQDIAEIEYVPIETSKNIQVDMSGGYQVTQNRIVCCNKRTGELLFFDRKGRYLSNFNHKGGKGYKSIQGWLYDEKSDELFINDFFPLRRILVYSSKGLLKRKINTLLDYEKMLNYDDNTLIVRRRYLDNDGIAKTIKKSKDYLLISKKDGKLISTINYSLLNQIPTIIIRDLSKDDCVCYRPIRPNDIIGEGRNFFISDISSDTIYKYDNKKLLQPFIVYKSAIKEDTLSPMIHLVSKITDKFVFITRFRYDFKSNVPRLNEEQDFGINLIDNKIFYPKLVNLDFQENLIPIISFSDILTPQNMAAYSFDTKVLLVALEKNKLNGALKLVASKLHQEDNPVLVILKFK